MLKVTTQVFGVRGEKGDLCLEPKLMKEQFGKKGQAEIFSTFRNTRIKVIYLNDNFIEYGKYQIKNLKINGVIPLYTLSLNQTKLTIKNELLNNFCKEKIYIIEVSLG